MNHTHQAAKFRPVYVTPEEVRCTGEHRGGLCDKLLLESLGGWAVAKCSRCGTRKTYRRKGVDVAP